MADQSEDRSTGPGSSPELDERGDESLDADDGPATERRAPTGFDASPSTRRDPKLEDEVTVHDAEVAPSERDE